jgi:hypothetical protein
VKNNSIFFSHKKRKEVREMIKKLCALGVLGANIIFSLAYVPVQDWKFWTLSSLTTIGLFVIILLFDEHEK